MAEYRQDFDIIERLVNLICRESRNGSAHFLAIKILRMIASLAVPKFLNLFFEILTYA